MMDQGKTFVEISITEKLTRLNATMETNEERTNGEFHVDFGKFFKNQATNLDVTIFEETCIV
jgi:5-hydroxyisourate hydrolase-like protein (transthyretin family)